MGRLLFYRSDNENIERKEMGIELKEGLPKIRAFEKSEQIPSEFNVFFTYCTRNAFIEEVR